MHRIVRRTTVILAAALVLLAGTTTTTPAAAAAAPAFISNGDGSCLGVRDKAEGRIAFTAECGALFAFQQWDYVFMGTDQWRNSWYQLKNRGSGLCLVVQTGQDKPAFQYRCLPQYVDQHWTMPFTTLSADGPTSFVNRNGSKCLEKFGAHSQGYVHQWTCEFDHDGPVPAQRWLRF
ncbi:hypothetical protein GCM10009557_02480 [Virgisporangium ochraceum]|uniref:Ricin B lectin domain-containing protein n=1 Tax=Virgisporangium ochraceum TaxID=65505 RepID=A0A8J3ZZC3_9ACTN|nr:RICIN domain-containing protein [Virgisporangium ochraceum]GIJ72827.1 hypothetical protein Voc01_077440 [Virgisporangium ochraceum]